MDILVSLPDDCVKLVFCDPPYDNGTHYNSYVDNRPDYEDWCRKWFKECRRIAERVIVTPGHGNLWMWGQIEKPFGVGCWYKPGNPASSVLGWCCWEPWLYYCRGAKILGGPDTIRAPVTKQKYVGNHPAPKPLGLLKQLIKKTTKEGDIVLDPFAGSGTTCVAAKLLERHYIGIEIDSDYINIINNRLSRIIDLFD